MTGLEFAAGAGRALHLTALAVATGAGLAPTLGRSIDADVGPGADLGALDAVSARWRRTAGPGLLVALAILLVTQTLAFHDPFEPLAPQVGGLLTRTDWGRTFLVQFGLAVALILPAIRRRSGPFLVGALMSAATLAFTGHSWGATSYRAGVVAADALHAIAASTWLGGLLVVVAAARLDRSAARARGIDVADQGRSFDLAGTVARFSALALVAVPTLIVTGGIALFAHGGGIGALLTPGWGRALAVKLGLFAVMAAAGFYNWRVTLPALRRRADDLRFGSGAPGWEALLGWAVLVVTAVLIALPPPQTG